MSRPNTKMLFNQGIQAEKKEDYSTALNLYKKVIEIDPQFRAAYINLGSLLSRAYRYRLALKSFKKALRLKEDFVVLFNLGVLFYRIHRFPSAIGIWERALAHRDQFARLHLLLGFAYAQDGQLKNAENAYKNVLKLEKDNLQALLALGFLYYNRKKYQAALAYVKRYLELVPDNQDIKDLQQKILFKYIPDGQQSVEHEPLDQKQIKQFLINQFGTEPAPFSLRPTDKGNASTQQMLADIDKKIQTKMQSIEKKQHSDKQAIPAKDHLDLSLLNLFKGDMKSAMDHLASARTSSS